MSLQERMERLRCRHTYGAKGPIYFLLHKEDVSYMEDLLWPEKEQREKLGIEQIQFHGVTILESPLAKKGEPLAVVTGKNEGGE